MQFLLRWEEGGQVVQQARDRRRSEGEREEEIERQRKKNGGRTPKHNRKCRNGFVYPAGGETVSHFLCFVGSGLISPSVTSVSLAAVAKCDTKVF